MKKIDLGQTITILANLGVIAGIAFLAIELRQNNQLLSEQARYSLLQNQKDWTFFATSDEEVARLIYGTPDVSALTELDSVRRLEIIASLLFAWQWEFERAQSRLFDESDLPVEAYRWGWQIYDLAGVWGELKNQFSPEFVKFMEESVVN